MIATDRFLEMDLTWFDPNRDVTPQIEMLLKRTAPLLHPVSGWRGVFFNVGWLIDLVTEWRGQTDQLLPTHSRRTAQWGQRSYGELAAFFRQLRSAAAAHHLPDLRIGLLFVNWGEVVWPPELKIYDFDSDWYKRHPELYDPPLNFIGMPVLNPGKRLNSDAYPYATFPKGLPDNTSFADFFAAQWAHLADFLDLDLLNLRDGFTGPMVYTRNGPYGTAAPADPDLLRAFSQSVRDLFRAVKTAAPSKLVFGYSSAISPVADWRVGCVDFESLIADGYIDGWIEQTWGGAWQDWWHQLWKGWTFQTANLLTRGAMIAAANQRRAAPCKFYNLIETWDGWEPWDTLHQVPHKLRWAMWAFSHTAVQTPQGLKPPDGSYISWLNNGQMELLSEQDVTYINTHLNAAQENALSLEKVYGPSLVYNHAMMAHLSANQPDINASEWLDDQAAMLMKWGIPILNSTRMEWLAEHADQADSLITQIPGALTDAERQTLLTFERPLLAVGRAELLDEKVREKLGITLIGMQIDAGFHIASGERADTPANDRPYLPDHTALMVSADTTVHYRTASTPLLISRTGSIYWQPPDWSEPNNQFLPKYQLGSTFPHFYAAALLHDQARQSGLSHIADVMWSQPIAFHLWRSAGAVYLLFGNLETGELGDSRTPRTFRVWLSRSQLELAAANYCLSRVDEPGKTVPPQSEDDLWLTFDLTLPPQGSAVYRVDTP